MDDSYLKYPHRRYGMDHDRYAWSMLAKRDPVQWPGGKRLALWVNVGLNFFPLDQRGVPFKVAGGMTMPYPDLRHYSLRDYGNRVGIYRFFRAFDRLGLKPTFAFNTRLAQRVPYLLRKVVERGDEIICHGYHMDALHHGGMDVAEEDDLIKRSLDELRRLSGQPIKGWLSPAKSQSANTPDLLAAHGVEYVCDWVNDDMPYPLRTKTGTLHAMPLSTELEDRFVLLHNLHSEDSYVQQVLDACDFLLEESKTHGGRMLALSIHPWVLGQPHRIGKLEALLEQLMAKEGVWSAHAGRILEAATAQL